MKLQILTATAALAISTAAYAADGHFERTLNVGASPDLYVQTGSGNITVHPGSGNQIHIAGHITSSWNLFGGDHGSNDAIRHIEENPPIAQEGNEVKVGFVHNADYQHISIDYDITAPAGVALNLKSGSGDVTSDGVGRFVTATSGSGNVKARGVSGPADLESGSGDITLEERAAGDVKARTGSGNVHIHGFNGALVARSGSGDIDADGRLNGAAQLDSGSGNVKLHLGNDAKFNLEASTGSGDIRIHYPGAPQQDEHSRHHMTAPINGGGPPLQVRTGSGDVEISS
jgi:hypothetical protein